MSILMDNVLQRLEKVKKTPNGYVALCPVHHEKTPSLSIKEKDGKILMHCFGCHADGKEIAPAIGLQVADLFEESLSPDNRIRAEYRAGKEQLETLDLKVKFYQIEIGKGLATPEDKAKFMTMVADRRRLEFKMKKLKQRLLQQ